MPQNQKVKVLVTPAPQLAISRKIYLRNNASDAMM